MVLPLDDDQFETWLESSDTIFLNKLPVRYESRRSIFDASQRHGPSGRM
ncbi:MAG TPA: hypothetical protein VNA04_16915 [Thermoanaerobaculia bacterium]|nr:hypothetical protein [Thermoanaerobaculia bacterium]